MKICSRKRQQAAELCGLGHNAAVEKLPSSLLQIPDFSLPPAQAEIGCNNSLKTKPLSPQILISYCPKEKAAFNHQLLSWCYVQCAEFNGARCTWQGFTGNLQQWHEVWMSVQAVNLPFIFWKTGPAGGYLITWVTPGKAHLFALPFCLSRSSKPEPGQQLPESWS